VTVVSFFSSNNDIWVWLATFCESKGNSAMLYVVAHFAATDDTQTLWAEALYGVAHFARWAEA
jgi:hypothetical protein